MSLDMIDAFAKHQAGRGFSPATVERRTLTLRAFYLYTDPTPLLSATSELVEEFVYSKRAPTTRHAYLSDLRVFYTWAHRRGLAAVNPCERVDPIRVPRSLPRPVDAQLVRPLIDRAPSWPVAVSIALAAYAGLRRAEIAGLDVSDVSLAAAPPVLTVRHGKGGKDRTIPLHPQLVAVLSAGMPRAGSVVGLSVDAVGRQVAEHLRASGVPATLHQLRHTFGTEAARVTAGDLLLVADMMGHDSPNTTVAYTKLVGRDAAGAVSAMFATDAA